MFPVIAKVGLAALATGVAGTLVYNHKNPKKPIKLSWPKKPAPKPSGGLTPVTPPGKPQPPGIVLPPPHSASGDDPVHAAAAALVQAIQGMGSAPTGSFAACSNFQGAFNAVSSTKLATDGIYGPKSQAALQSVITPAVAPPNMLGTGATAATPAVPAPPPDTSVDVFTAASNLVAMGSIPKASIAAVTTFQHAYNGHGPAQALTEDGKYGPMSQAALQSVINAMGSGQSAPKNPYGAALPSIPTFPG